jgi:TfoX/Sxy family transcriptional regulator of competence genes
MAEPYLDHLSHMVDRLELPQTPGVTLESKHFFSGAALYANGKICASLSPMGLAVKLPADIREELISEGKGTEFRFFASGPIKREYVALSETIIQDDEALGEILSTSVDYVTGLLEPDVVDETR